MTKKQLRNIYRDKRIALSLSDQSKLDDLMLIQLQRTEIPFVSLLLSYCPITFNKEPSTDLFARYLSFLNPALTIAYPRSDFQTFELEAVYNGPGATFIVSSSGIPEPVGGDVIDPSEIDIVFVPLLAFDMNGYRVGYGKGFYDRFLSKCREDCIKVGFSYFEPVDVISDKDVFDVPLNLCITPQNIYVF